MISEKTFARILKAYGHYNWVHTINNAAVVIMGLMYGEKDLGKTAGIAVMGRIQPSRPDDRGVRDQVREQKHADGEDPAQRVQAAEQQVVTVEKPRFAVGHDYVPIRCRAPGWGSETTA